MGKSWTTIVVSFTLGLLAAVIIHWIAVDDDFFHEANEVERPPLIPSIIIDVHKPEYVTHAQLSESITNIVQSMMLYAQDTRDQGFAWAAEAAEAGDAHVWWYMDYLSDSMEEILDPASPYNQHMMGEAIEIVEFAAAAKLVPDDEGD